MGALNMTLHRTQRAIHNLLCPQKLCFADDSIGFKVGDAESWTSIRKPQEDMTSSRYGVETKKNISHTGHDNPLQSHHKLNDWPRRAVRHTAFQDFRRMLRVYNMTLVCQ